MAVKAKDQDEWKNLPQFVVINSRVAAMFNDRELSGLYLAQWGGIDDDGNEIKNWGYVPKEYDCSRIKAALDANNLFPCNPKGESKLLPKPIIMENSLDELMSRNARELIAIADQQQTVTLLYKMKDWEERKPQKEQRIPMLQAIANRLNDTSVKGMTRVESNTARLRNELTDEMEEDTILIG